jgi:hypothetical protein
LRLDSIGSGEAAVAERKPISRRRWPPFVDHFASLSFWRLRLLVRRKLSPFISRMCTVGQAVEQGASQALDPNTDVHSSKGRLLVISKCRVHTAG